MRTGGPLYSDSRFADEAFLSLGQEELDELASLPLSELRLINAEHREGATLGRRNGEAARLAGGKLRVIGDTALQPDLPDAFPEVAFTGWVDQGDIGRHLADCRALVVPSRYPEPFGLVAAEASRSGLPVLISDVMPLAREVADRRLGLAVNSRSAEALADDLRRAAALPAAELRDVSIRAFAAEDTFSLTPEAWMDRLEALYARAARAG